MSLFESNPFTKNKKKPSSQQPEKSRVIKPFSSNKLDEILELLKGKHGKTRLAPLNKIEEYLLKESKRTSTSRNRRENDATREIGLTKFRFKDIKNWYKLVEILLEKEILFE